MRFLDIFKIWPSGWCSIWGHFLFNGLQICVLRYMWSCILCPHKLIVCTYRGPIFRMRWQFRGNGPIFQLLPQTHANLIWPRLVIPCPYPALFYCSQFWLFQLFLTSRKSSRLSWSGPNEYPIPNNCLLPEIFSIPEPARFSFEVILALVSKLY